MLICLALLFTTYQPALSQWAYEQTPVKLNLNSVYFVTDQDGWAVGDSGTILKRSNRGWISYKSPTNVNLFSVFMIKANDGWIVGERGVILHYNGEEWEMAKSPTIMNLYSVKFNSPDNGVAVGGYGQVLVYRNKEWVQIENLSMANLSVSGGPGKYWISGYQEGVSVPIVSLSADSLEFKDKFENNHYTIRSIHFVNENEGWAVGENDFMLHYDGNKWNSESLSINFPALRSVHFNKNKIGLSAGFNGTVLKYDSIYGWNKEAALTDINLNSVFVTDNKYYVAGNNGAILSAQLPARSLPETGITEPESITIYQFGSVVKIMFPELYNSTANIQMFAPNGIIIKNIKLEVNTGSSNYTMPVSDVASGIYLLKAEIAGVTKTVKLFIR